LFQQGIGVGKEGERRKRKKGEEMKEKKRKE